jgi:transaldolase
MIKEGEELADLHEQIVVKLPMTKEGVMATNISDREKRMF